MSGSGHSPWLARTTPSCGAPRCRSLCNSNPARSSRQRRPSALDPGIRRGPLPARSTRPLRSSRCDTVPFLLLRVAGGGGGAILRMAPANSGWAASGTQAAPPTRQTLDVIGTRPLRMPCTTSSVVTGPITSEPSFCKYHVPPMSPRTCNDYLGAVSCNALPGQSVFLRLPTAGRRVFGAGNLPVSSRPRRTSRTLRCARSPSRTSAVRRTRAGNHELGNAWSNSSELCASPVPGCTRRCCHRWVDPSDQRLRAATRCTLTPLRGTSSSGS